MFHAPFGMQQRPCRFSPHGVPALYLANSVYLCWKECDEPPLDDCHIARFEVDAPAEDFLDLACSHEAYVAPLEHADLGVDPRRVTNGPLKDDVVDELAGLWPCGRSLLLFLSLEATDQPSTRPNMRSLSS